MVYDWVFLTLLSLILFKLIVDELRIRRLTTALENLEDTFIDFIFNHVKHHMGTKE